MRTTAVLFLLFIQGALAAEPQISIKSHLSAEEYLLHDLITNSIVIRIPVDRDAGLFAADVRCQFPGDPVWKGLATTGARFAEKLVVTGDGVREKEYRITWTLSPQYAGTMVLKPVAISFFRNGQTNTVLTPVKSIVVREAASGLELWILGGTVLVFSLTGFIYNSKLKKRTVVHGPQTPGGSNGE